jgi:hypothetical protein
MLRHYVNPTQDNWDECLDAAEFAINNAFQESIRTTPFFLNYGQNPLTPVMLEAQGQDVPEARRFVGQMQEHLQMAKAAMSAAQSRQKTYYDQKRREVSFEVGQQVLLSTKNIRLKSPGAQKLLPKFIGPFEIEAKVGQVAYKLSLPSSYRVHPVFHVALLKGYRNNGTVQPPLPESIEGDLHYEVEAIVGHRDKVVGTSRTAKGVRKRTRREYLIKWTGYGVDHNTWEPETELSNCRESIREYWNKHPSGVLTQ